MSESRPFRNLALCGLIFVTAGVLLSGCATATDRSSAKDADEISDLAVLLNWLTGSFSSQAQAEVDPENFWDIRLEMSPIWTDRTDAHWFYVEQAAATHLDKPYRQRVYRVVEAEPGLFTSEVFALPEPEKAVGAWKQDQPLAEVTPEDLVVRVGCTVYLLRSSDGAFTGGTRDRDCTSSLRGATYATTEITVTADRIVSWDRGYDDAGVQVWGAEKAGYIFLKIDR